jgi:hypothetical protein
MDHESGNLFMYIDSLSERKTLQAAYTENYPHYQTPYQSYQMTFRPE